MFTLACKKNNTPVIPEISIPNYFYFALDLLPDFADPSTKIPALVFLTDHENQTYEGHITRDALQTIDPSEDSSINVEDNNFDNMFAELINNIPTTKFFKTETGYQFTLNDNYYMNTVPTNTFDFEQINGWLINNNGLTNESVGSIQTFVFNNESHLLTKMSFINNNIRL